MVVYIDRPIWMQSLDEGVHNRYFSKLLISNAIYSPGQVQVRSAAEPEKKTRADESTLIRLLGMNTIVNPQFSVRQVL